MKLVLTTETHQKAKEHCDLFLPSVEVERNVVPILTDTVGYHDTYNSIISTTVIVKAHVWLPFMTHALQTRVLGEALFIGCIWRHDYHEWSNEWKQRNVMMPTLWSLATPKWGQRWHHDSFLMNVLHNNIFIPTAYFIMTSILMRLILIGCINLTPTNAEIGSNISTTEEATTITNRSSSADMTSKYVPKWLKWFVRSDNMTTITLRDDHNMTVLPARSFALWPETQVGK